MRPLRLFLPFMLLFGCGSSASSPTGREAGADLGNAATERLDAGAPESRALETGLPDRDEDGALPGDGEPGRDGATEREPDASGRDAAGPRDTAADSQRADTRGAADVGTADSGIPVPTGYKLVWNDEFDRDGAPDPANWGFENGFVRNEEAQWYQPDNARVEGGLLIIEARKERKANPKYVAGSSDWKTNRQYAEYTSASLLTSGKRSWQFGRFEMRGRIPTAAGVWPAWWTLGVAGEWPSNGEIDIMEFYKGKVLANVACGTSTRWSAKWDSATKPVTELGAGWADQFHVWRMDWDDQKIDLILDEVVLNSVPLSSMLNPDGKSPFRQAHYMILNLALGGVNGGDPSGASFPARYEIDYVRVYQKL